MRDNISLRKFYITILALCTFGIGQILGDGVYIQFKGWWANGYSDGERAYVKHNGSGEWIWYETVDLGGGANDHWYYYETPSGITAFDIGRGTSTSVIHNNVYNNNNGAGIYVKNGDEDLGHYTGSSYTAGWEDSDPDNNRWIKVYANNWSEATTIKSTNTKYDQDIGTTVALNLKEFGAWTYKYNNKNGAYGNVGRLTLNYVLGKDGEGDKTEWKSTYTTDLGEGENEKNNIVYQPWKWSNDLDLLSNLTDKSTLSSGRYYIKYFWSALVNRATGYDCVETIYFSRNGSNYFIHFTIPAPQVEFTSEHPYAGFECLFSAGPKYGTTIYGQTFQYQFEQWNGSSWVVIQSYSDDNDITYTPTSTSNRVRVKMKVKETNEESAYVEQDIYEQYYIYVEDTQNWGQMWEAMKNTNNNTYYLNRAFPGEKILPCDTVDGKPIYRITLDSYYHRLWLSVGNNTKQTYNDGFPINFDLLPTYGIKKVHAGHWFKIVPGSGGANDCYLKDYSTAIFRVVSYDGETGKTYYSNAISPTEGKGTVSFYANVNHASSYVKIQTWSDGNDEGGADNVDGTWITSDVTNFQSACSTASSGRNTVFVATLSNSTLSEIGVYDGDYHIHVYANTENNLDGGMPKGGVGTKFTYFEPNTTIFGIEDFDHYWVDWFTTEDISVVATVGNTYNTDLAGVISTDPYAPYGQTASGGANVRYGYNPSTNYFSRTMIAGSGSQIKILGARVNPNNSGYNTMSSFSDASSWVYTIEAVVKGKATATVTTSYNSFAQTLTEDQQLIGGDLDDNITEYTVVITYDFKTNRLLAAWTPSGTIDDGFDLSSNLMVVRTENGAPTALNITGSTDLTNISKIYTAIELLQSSWRNSTEYSSRRINVDPYCDEYYWISFPYDCYVGDIFGIDGYGDSWVIQTYLGAERAKTGWWAETESWWANMERTDTLKANEGYVLRVTNLDGDYGTTRVFADNSGDNRLYLYFPSLGNNLKIGKLGESTSYTLNSLLCTKWKQDNTEPNHGENNPRWDRRAIDSNWRIIGSPSFNTTKMTDPTFSTGTYPTSPSGYSLKYFYTWAANTNPKYTITSANDFEFKATHAYLVQYAGTINWAPYTNTSTDPLVGIKASAPKKENDEQSDDQTLKMVLKRGEEQADVTYISRMAEGATDGYDLNLDLSKLLSTSGNNLYTIAGYYKMAGNCLPDTVTYVPVGVQLATSGEYTFSMPNGTNGTGAVLVDNTAGTRTNLALTDYTVNLEKGTYDNRFALELSQSPQTPTSIETPEQKNNGICKKLIDGILYIVRDGKVYDAQGIKIK